MTSLATMYDRDLTSRRSADLWKHLLEEASTAGTLVLVNNLLMEREVRRKWQRDRNDFAPDIRTLESWLEELALHSLHDDSIPDLLIHDEERTLWLEQWLSAHPDSDFRRFAGARSVTAISNIIGSLYRDNHRPSALLGLLRNRAEKSGPESGRRRYTLAELLTAYEKEMDKKNWLDREQLVGRMTKVSPVMMRYDRILLYCPDELDVIQEKALKLIAKSDDSPEMVIIRFDESEISEPASQIGNFSEDSGSAEFETVSDHRLSGSKSDDEKMNDISNAGMVYLEQFHHPREELEEAARHILTRILQQNGGKDEVEPDDEAGPPYQAGAEFPKESEYNRINSLAGSQFDDYVILTGDLSLYESMVESVSDRFDIPLYTSRGMSLISHPFIRRLLTYLKLEHNGFQIDDIFRVFADNRVVLPDLEGHDEQKPPNIRHFSQFCRAYNFRTLDEVSAGMDRVFDWLLDQIHYEDDEEREEKRKSALRRDREFYDDVVRHLQAIRKRYKTPDRQNLTGWVDWADSLLELQKDLMSREANEVRELLTVILEKVAKAQAKLGLGTKISRYDFFKLLELRLKETRERPTERPGEVLLTEIRHLPEVHDKIVFVLGLHEDGFPRPVRPDFLQFRYERALQELTGRDGTEAYDLARMQLRRILASEQPRFLSRPALVEQKKVMPSPLWLEIEEQMRTGRRTGNVKNGWPDGREKWLMSDYEIGISAARGELQQDDESVPDDKKKVIKRFQHAMNVEQDRQNAGRMGRYDGVVDQSIMEQWRKLQMDDGRISMSISRLDTFASSPQEYFYKYVLRLQPLHEYQDDAESNIKGSLLHNILQDFYSTTEEEGPPIRPVDDPGAAQERMKAIRLRLMEAYRHQLGNPESPFPEILTKNLEQITRWFIEEEVAGYPVFSEGLEEARPSVFYPDCDISMEHRWEFEKKLDDVTVSFRGMIDRIDLTPDGKSGVIFDYKSGKFGVKKYKAILEGCSFQLPVYGMYLRERKIPNFLAGYYQLPVNGKRKDVGITFALGSAELISEQTLNTKSGRRKKTMVQYKSAEELEAFLTAIEKRRIAWIVRAIREGRFHVSLIGNPKWLDSRFISRFDSRVQHMRSNYEQTGRNANGMVFELDRYYLAAPLWEDEDE